MPNVFSQMYWAVYYRFAALPKLNDVLNELSELKATIKKSAGEAAPKVVHKDCLITAGGKTVGCIPNYSVADCLLISSLPGGKIGTPVDLGTCGRLPR